MKLLVVPIYGWGWFYAAGNALDVPSPFEIEVSITEPGQPFKSVLGVVNAASHPLSERWILLSPRHDPFDGNCNLRVFSKKPVVPKISEPLKAVPDISGFAQVRILNEA